jgi:hypothetical protein
MKAGEKKKKEKPTLTKVTSSNTVKKTEQKKHPALKK